jgi:hypothetical protein
MRFAFLSGERFIIEIDRSLGRVQNGLQECPYTSHCGISRPPLFCSINFFNHEDSENSEGYPDDPEPADGDNANGIIFSFVVQPKYRSKIK